MINEDGDKIYFEVLCHVVLLLREFFFITNKKVDGEMEKNFSSLSKNIYLL